MKSVGVADSVGLPQKGNCLSPWRTKCCSQRKATASELAAGQDRSRRYQKEILCLDGLELVFNPGDCGNTHDHHIYGMVSPVAHGEATFWGLTPLS